MLRMRLAFRSRLQRLHERTLAKHSSLRTLELEAQAHEAWSELQTQGAKRQKRESTRLPCPACAAYASNPDEEWRHESWEGYDDGTWNDWH